MKSKTSLIVGVGNILLSDEGVGIHVLRELEKRNKLPDSTFLDLGTSSLDIEYYMDKHIEKIIIIDCIKSEDHGPGTIFKFRPEDIKKIPSYDYSLHQLELVDSLRLASLTKDVPNTLILGVVPYSIDVFSENLSKTLREKLSGIIEKIEKEIIVFLGK